MQEEISDQWACWGLSFFIQVDLFCRNKNGSNVYDFIDSAALFGSFLLLWGFYWTAGWTLSERRVRHTVRTEHTSLNQAWTLLQHTCGKPHTTGGHTQWTGEGYNTTHNKPPTTPQNCSPEADVSSHTNQNSFDFILLIQCLTSGPKKPHRDQFISLDQLKLYRLHWADLSPTLGPRWTHSVFLFMPSALWGLSDAGLWSDCFFSFDRRSVWTVWSSTVSCSAGVFFPFLFNGFCFLHRNKV